MKMLKIKEMNTLEVLKIDYCHPSDPPFIKYGGEIEIFGISRGALEVSYFKDVCLNLQHVETVDCNALVEVGALETTLINLNLRGCGALRKVGGLCGLSKLPMLNISGCKELEELPSIETFVSLELCEAK